MDQKSLKTFIKYVESGCSANSLEEIGVGRTLFWQRINAIEKLMGVQLVTRAKQKNELTDRGRLFYEHAQKIVEAYEDAQKDVSGTSQPHTNQITISAAQSLARTWTLPAFVDFLAMNPEFKLNISASDHITRETELTTDVLFRSIADSSTFIRRWYIEYHHGLYASQSYLEKFGIPQSVSDLNRHTVLSYGPSPYTNFEDVDWHLYLQKNEALQSKLSVNSTTTLFELATLGAGIISCAAETNALYEGNLVRILPDVKGPTFRSYFAVNPNTLPINLKKIESFENLMRKYLGTRLPIIECAPTS